MKTTRNTKPETKTPSKAWNCKHCHATNVTTFCGCLADRKERGAYIPGASNLDSIELFF